jgi:hypothetical protein
MWAAVDAAYKNSTINLLFIFVEIMVGLTKLTLLISVGFQPL